jgi:hypothetical protein
MAHRWGGKTSYCVYCGNRGPRTIVLGGKAHSRCIPKPDKAGNIAATPLKRKTKEANNAD